MGLTKQYLKYVPSGTFNIITSSNCNSVFVSLNGINGRYIAVGACEHVIIWDLRLGEKVQILAGERTEVCCLATSPAGNYIAVGYVDGAINVYDLNKSDVVCVFSGHKSAVTCLQYDDEGHRLVSGSKDTDIIVWDIVSEAGLVRFTGHKGEVTSVSFINTRNCVVSSSKDTFVKFWDLETKHCFKTLGGHQTEIWASVVMKEEQFLVTGCVDSELRVWKLHWRDEDKQSIDSVIKKIEIVKLEEGESFEDNVLQCHQTGSLIRGGHGRVLSLVTDQSQTALCCYGTDMLLEVFKFCSDDEAKRRLDKRIKKQKKKLQKAKEAGNTDISEEIIETLTLGDLVCRLQSTKVKAKIKSCCVIMGDLGEMRFGLTTSDNAVHLYSLDSSISNSESICLKSITQLGHRVYPRCVCISSDNLAVLSASNDSIKLWNRVSQKCVRTIELSVRPVSVCLVPGDRHCIVGTSTGHILLVELAAASIFEEIPAHTNEVWSVGLTPDQRGCFSGGGDKTIKLWQFELVPLASGETKAKVLSIVHTRTLELDEGVLAVKISPNSKYIAVALLDSTVKIFFYDTFKFYLSLYGHKLPVLCLDISYDSNLIVTGSADRNVKIWGLDFGDCHRSIFAHNDSVTTVQFVPSTHYFFSGSKDGKIKQWDADSFENIIVLQGHLGECWSLSVGSGGLYIVSSGSDHALRLWDRSDEVVVIGDREDDEEGLVTGERAPVPGLPNLNMPSKKTIGTEKAAESLLECLEVGEAYRLELIENGGKADVPVLMMAYKANTPEDFLIETLMRIRSSDLEEALLMLPFKWACHIIEILPRLLKRDDCIELLCRLCVFLMRVHNASIVANNVLLKHLIKIQSEAAYKLNQLRDTVGYNIHALKWLQRDLEVKEGESLFFEKILQHNKKEKRKKARQAVKRPLITIT